MTLNRLSARAGVTVVFACVGAAWLSAQKPPKSVTTVAATASFRCDSPDTNKPCETTEAVHEDADHIVHEGLGTYEGGILGARFFLRIPTGRELRLFLHGALEGSLECAVPGVLAGCNPDDESLRLLAGTGIDLTAAEVSIAVLDPATLAETAGGLVAMGCGETGLALVHYTAWLPGGDGHWGLNFNPRPLYHATGVVVTRVGNTWVLEASTSHYAELVSFNHSGIRRKAGPSHEGRYFVPFQLTIEPTGPLPSGSVSCN